MALRKTKIVCTMGPAVQDVEIIKQLLIEGMNVARFNFSHGDHQYHQAMAEMVRDASRQTGIPVALLLDTKGPEIRTGRTKENRPITLIAGNRLTLTTDDLEGDAERLSISYHRLPQDVKPGTRIYIADGVIELEVERVEGNLIQCMIREGGEIGGYKNVNVTGVHTALPAVTEKDRADILFAVREQFDFIAASFVRKGADILEIRRLLEEQHSNIHIIAKIEDEEGVENIDEIINLANGIMVARGDLGVQLQTEEIPLVQKRIIRKCNLAKKPVITATQMLDSMIHNPRPTRAETSDVANAIFDGTDAVMLSGETASGKYPVLAVRIMHQIALRVEESPEFQEKMADYFEAFAHADDIAAAVAKGAFITASSINASAILTPSLRGNTPKIISQYRPPQQIIAVTTTEHVQRNLLLYWGVYPIVTGIAADSDDMITNALKLALQKKYIRNADRVVMVAGIPIHSPVMLNTIRVYVISTILGKGVNGFGNICTGRIVKAADAPEASVRITGSGDEILLTRTLDDRFLPLLSKVSGVIVEEYSTLSSEEAHLIKPDLVVISGVPDALATFEQNLLVSLDGREKLIYEGVLGEE